MIGHVSSQFTHNRSNPTTAMSAQTKFSTIGCRSRFTPASYAIAIEPVKFNHKYAMWFAEITPRFNNPYAVRIAITPNQPRP